jgi:RNA polymerase sigma-70 factor (ECF subfamily)
MDFDDFYRDEHRRVLGLCLLVTLDVEAAADVTQEAMLRAWERWEQLVDRQPEAWVLAVAMNLCRSRWRRLQRELRHLSRAITIPVTPQIRDPELLNALGRLPRRQREAIVLFYWADLSIDDCAIQMGVSPGTVKQHLSRARDHLGNDRAIRLMKETP